MCARALRASLALCCLLGVIASMAGSARAANGTWSGVGMDGNWNNAANWVGGVIPGATTGTTNGDTATFNSAATQTTVVVDAGRNTKSIVFDTAAAAAFTISGSTLLLTNGGSISMTATALTNNQTITAPLSIQGANATYSLIDNAGTTTASSKILLVNGSITAAAAGNTVLTLDGTALNNSTTSGAIGNGSATTLAVIKNGAGLWALSGTNSYTGANTLSVGTLSVGADANLGAATNGLVFNGGILQVTGTTLTNFGTHPPAFTATKTVGLDIATGASFTVAQVLNQTTGGLSKLGAGTLTLSNTNTYSGATSISGGVLSVSSDANLGTAPTAAAANINLSGGGQLLATAGFTLGTTRSIVMGTGGGSLNGSTGTLAFAGGISGANTLSKFGVGTFAYTGTASISSFQGRGGTTLVDSGGSITSSGGATIANGNEQATLTIQGTGRVTLSSDLNIIGNGGAAAAGTVNVADNATLSVGSLYVGKGFTTTGGTGTVNQTGGTVTVSSGPNVGARLGSNTGMTGIYNLNGGVLITPRITRGSGSGTFNFNGGVLRANANNTALSEAAEPAAP